MKNKLQWVDHMTNNDMLVSDTIQAAQYEVIDYIAENAKRIFELDGSGGVDVKVDKEYILGLKKLIE